MKKLYIGTDKRLCGVCDGIARYLNVDPVLIRTLVVCVALLTAIVPVLLVYIIVALVLPNAPEGTVEVEYEYKKIHKSNNRKISGVCGGIAEYFNIDATIVRLIFVLLTLWVGGGIICYIVSAIMFPSFDPFENQSSNTNPPV